MNTAVVTDTSRTTLCKLHKHTHYHMSRILFSGFPGPVISSVASGVFICKALFHALEQICHVSDVAYHVVELQPIGP